MVFDTKRLRQQVAAGVFVCVYRQPVGVVFGGGILKLVEHEFMFCVFGRAA